MWRSCPFSPNSHGNPKSPKKQQRLALTNSSSAGRDFTWLFSAHSQFELCRHYLLSLPVLCAMTYIFATNGYRQSPLKMAFWHLQASRACKTSELWCGLVNRSQAKHRLRLNKVNSLMSICEHRDERKVMGPGTREEHPCPGAHSLGELC